MLNQLKLKLPKMAKNPSPPPSPTSFSSSSSSSSETSSSSSYSFSSSDDDDQQRTANSGSNNNEEEEESSYKQLQNSNEIKPSNNNNSIFIIKKRPTPKDRTLFKRIWSRPDEIAILNGMVEYRSANSVPVPMTATAIGDLHASIADSLSIEVNNSQLRDKVRRLRKRYRFASTRTGRNGEAQRFKKAHDQAVYELSKRVWGGGEGEKERVRPRAVKNRVEVVRRWCPLLMEAVEGTGNPAVAREAVEGMEPARARDLEEKMKRRKVEWMKHQLQKMELQRETVKLVMEGIKRSSRSL